VHRLDKDTSGLMLVAKNDEAHRYLSKAISIKQVERKYKAIVWGVPKQKVGIINANIARHVHDRKKMSVVKNGGRISITGYKVLNTYGFASLIECDLQTGRTHQIRVHLASIGLPLIGDQLYAKGKTVSSKMPNILQKFPRQALHSYSINFIHPYTKEELKFKNIFPEDIKLLQESIEAFI
ncbi:MAG TPA: RluA family pseudouridine synthase, partial [Alphaproteobacteria bacterium]|nr:RluA family pseudouridine synthase [Alphaproteobacteria bacterium]